MNHDQHGRPYTRVTGTMRHVDRAEALADQLQHADLECWYES